MLVYGTALVEDPKPIGEVTANGGAQLLDVVPGAQRHRSEQLLGARPQRWREGICPRVSTASPTPTSPKKFVTQLDSEPFKNESCPRPPQRVHARPEHQPQSRKMIASALAPVTNGPTETVNNLIKRLKRMGYGLLFEYHRGLPA